MRVPLILAGPGIAPGLRVSQLVETVDVFPTLAASCGLEPPTDLEGSSFTPLMEDPTRAWKRGAFGQVTMRGARSLVARSVRTDRYRYTEWGSPNAAELYDHAVDPMELTNLATHPGHAALKAELRSLLHAGWRGALPD